jgi:hypothetical protein
VFASFTLSQAGMVRQYDRVSAELEPEPRGDTASRGVAFRSRPRGLLCSLLALTALPYGVQIGQWFGHEDQGRRTVKGEAWGDQEVALRTPGDCRRSNTPKEVSASHPAVAMNLTDRWGETPLVVADFS